MGAGNDFWSRVAGSKATVTSTYFGEGRFTARIEDWRTGANRNGRPFVVLETTVLASDDHERHPVGSSASWMQMLDMDMTAGNVKRALMGILRASEEDIVDSIVRNSIVDGDDPQAAGKKSPLAGVLVDIVGKGIRTKDGNPYTRMEFAFRDSASGVPDIAHRPRTAEERAAAEADSAATFP